MKIQVACKKGESTKQKGDLLEQLSKKLLEAQGYTVIEEIRVIGAELDLLCEHKVNKKIIYVECKAQKDPVAAPVLRQLWGTVDSEDYSEGWLISISDFTKDAKGFAENWKSKPVEKSTRLSFYTPDRVIDSLKDASIIKAPPVSNAENFIGDAEFIGEWTLLISQYGMFWCVYTLHGGAPHGVLVYNASNGRQIEEEVTLENLSTLDVALADYDLHTGVKSNKSKENPSTSSLLPTVVEVQTGESWDDYRPARPQDFVGRDSTQKDILNFLSSAKTGNGSRVFAVTGNSGLGKSSLVAKLRDRSKNKHYRKKYFVYAVDIRGARSSSYILSALITCLREAQLNGFGKKTCLNLTDPSTPLNSPSIQSYLDSLDDSGQIICLVFDQFEELYSKPELFSVFKAAKDLMLDVAGCKRNFVLGFAWKTDSTTQQDHPAYHMWHELADHRREYRLDVFDSGEISKSITTFEKEIKQKITAETRHQISNSSQGFPWLLKKLCINLYEGMSKGEGSESLLVDLDAERLFQSDLESLMPPELTCLKLVAQKAPAEWSEIIGISSPSVVNSLVNKRLVIKSGDRLNIYWDIFKDYLLTGRVPVIPFNYIPTSDLSSMLNICKLLVKGSFIDSIELASMASLNEKTVWNIGADLVMFGLAERDGTSFKIHRNMDEYNEKSALKFLRSKLGKHSLKISLYKKHAGKTIEPELVKDALITCLPKAKFGEKTWVTYSNRLTNFLIHAGFLARAGQRVIVQDSGYPSADRQEIARKGRQRSKVFSVSASPYATFEVLQAVKNGVDRVEDIDRKCLSVLKRFELVTVENGVVVINYASLDKFGGPLESIWSVAKNERSLIKCIEVLKLNPNISTKELAGFISNEFGLNWSEGSNARNGGSLKQWSIWVKEGIDTSTIPNPPGRPNKVLQQSLIPNLI